MNKLALSILIGISLLPSLAAADITLSYESLGGCSGDFERILIKGQWLRIDTRLDGGGGESGAGGILIYDGSEKLLFFVDNGARRYMQMELDEDALDLQADIMSSLRKYMRGKVGYDPFAMAESLCSGLGSADASDHLPDDPVDCGNGMQLGGQNANTDGGSADGNPVAGAANPAAVAGMGTDGGQALQQMLQQQMANMTPEQQAQMQQIMANAMPVANGNAALPNRGQTNPKAEAAPRIDHDAGEARVGELDCSRRQHLRGDELLREDCHASVALLKLDATDARRIARFGIAMKELGNSFRPAGKNSASEPKDQIVIQRICYSAGHESGRATLGMNDALIDEAIFALPAGYTPFDMQSDRGLDNDD